MLHPLPTTEGRVKFLLSQTAFNWGEGNVSIGTNPYIGAFWRNDEVGERVIRYKQTTNDIWRVQVVKGKEWIRLSKRGSQDSRINTSNARLDVEQIPGSDFALTSDTIAIWGSGGDILFRMGVNSKNNTGSPRYGVVVVQHAAGSQYLYLRQGEAADYVYRPTDPMEIAASGVTGIDTDNGDKTVQLSSYCLSGERTFAMKISPYNLTIPSNNPNINSSTQDIPATGVELGGQGGAWTKYPTQAGTLWFWNQTDARPNTQGFSQIASTAYYIFNPQNDPCPTGYHTPTDGYFNPGNGYRNQTDRCSARSEIQQTLLRYVLEVSSNVGHAYISQPADALFVGCYADGFFDRLQVNVTDKIVGKGINRATIGQLMYNHRSDHDASVFMPAAGYVDTNPLRSVAMGVEAYYNTLSGCHNTAHLIAFRMIPGQTLGMLPHGMAYGQVAGTIRCVKNDNVLYPAGQSYPAPNSGYPNPMKDYK